MLEEVNYYFDNFELDTDRIELRLRGNTVAVEPQVFALLLLLVERRDRLVTKEEIFETLWNGRVVTDSALTSRVKSARKALGDDGRTQRYIRTVHGKGFRFLAHTHVTHSRGPIGHVADGDQPEAHIGTSPRPSIAVLPFTNLIPGNTGDTLAEGLAHDLITELARLRWLLVIARGSSFRFREPDTDVREAGHALGVRYCLTGSIELSGQRLCVTAELIDARAASLVWGDQYIGIVDEVHALRAEIRSRILTALEIQIPLHEAADARLLSTDNLDAWSAYHLGLQHLYRYNSSSNSAAARLFEHAIAQDRHFARAHAGLSFVHFQTAFMRQTDDIPGAITLARSYAQRGLEIDPLDPFVNFTMGRSFWLESDLDSAGSWLERATELSPNYAQGLYALAWTSTIAGSDRDVRPVLDLAMRLSPLDPLYYAMLGARGFTHIAREEYGEAVAWTEKAARSPGAHVFMAVLAAAAQALAGNSAEAREWAANVRARGPHIRRADFFRGYPVRAEPMRSRIDSALQKLGF